MFSCGIFETFKNSGGCFWKSSHRGKLAIFNVVLFTLLHLLLTRWWDMWLMHDVAWLWEEQADSRNMCQNKKKYCSFCFTLIRIDTILSKNIYNNFQNLLFRKLLTQSGNQTYIFWKFYVPADILWLPKTVRRVLGYTTAHMLILNITFLWNKKILNLSFRRHILRSYWFLVEVIFKNPFLMILANFFFVVSQLKIYPAVHLNTSKALTLL